ncbi:MAG: capsule assembly Wzi family protein [bacterium]
MKSLLIFVFLILQPRLIFAQHTTVHLEHQVYPLLQKAETLRLFDTYQLRVLPLTRTAVLELLQKMKPQQNRLSMADQSLLAQMLAEFTDPEIGQATKPDGEIHFYRYEEGDVQFFLDMRVQQTFRFSRNRFDPEGSGVDENISETLAAGSVRGRFGRYFFIGLTARNTAIMGEDDLDENFDPDTGQIRSVVGGTAFNDQATGYLAARFGRFGILAGRNNIGWGSNLGEQLGLAAFDEPVDLLQLTLDFQRWRFSYFHANLQGIADQRYIAGHRLDFVLKSWLQVGVYETVVYGGRGVEPGYLNPLVPYHIMEHQLGDRDNNMFGFDWNAFIASSLRFYGEVFVDDFSFDKSLGTYWGNKLAYFAGLHWVQPFQLKTLELFASATRVDPFVFTHHDTLNIYSHYGKSAGSRLGPNAERWRLGLAWQPLRDARWQFFYNYSRKGRGDLLTAHRQEEGESKGYLKGTLEKIHDFRFSLRHQIKRDIFAGFYINIRNRKNANRIVGENRWERFARFFVDVNW